MKKQTLIGAAALLIACCPTAARAVGVTPSQDMLLDMGEVDFSGGTQMSSVTNTLANAGGVAYLINWDDSGESFTRVVLQKANFDADLSAFDSFDLQFTPFTEDIGVKPYIQTGDGFQFFETPFTSIAVADGPTIVSLDLTGLPNLNEVRQFGYQIFGPSGQGVSSTVLVQPAPGSVVIPEPTAGALACLTLLAVGLRRRT